MEEETPITTDEQPEPAGPNAPTGRRWRFDAIRRLKALLWWGLLGVAVIAPLAFGGVAFWYHPSATARDRSLLVVGLLWVVSWIILGLWKIPQWQARQASGEPGAKPPSEIENETRATLGEIIRGLGLIAGLIFTWYQIADTRNTAQRTLEITQQGQITERFTRAIDQLGSSAADVRVGGMYSLEQIAQDDPDAFYRPVMEVLAGYVREHNQFGRPLVDPSEQTTGAQAIGLPPDVRAALIVLTRRDDPPPGTGELRLNLSGTDLRGVILAEANLDGVDLTGAHLEGTDLTRADLEGAILTSTFTTGLFPAIFDDACLHGASLLNANISQGQIEAAITNAATILPQGIDVPPDEGGC